MLRLAGTMVVDAFGLLGLFFVVAWVGALCLIWGSVVRDKLRGVRRFR